MPLQALLLQPLYMRLLLNSAAGKALAASQKYVPRLLVGSVALTSTVYPPLLLGGASDRSALTYAPVMIARS